MAPQIPGTSADTPTPDQLTDESVMELVGQKIEDVISKRIDTEAEFEKVWQYMRLRKADLYYRGLQFVSPSFNSGYLDWSQSGSAVTAQEGDNQEYGIYDYHIDITHQMGRAYMAVLGTRPFYNAKAVPDDPQSEIDRRAARQADLCAAWLRNKWNIRIKNIEMFYLQYVAGTVYAFTPFIADKEIFGEIEAPQFAHKTVQVPTAPDPMTGEPGGMQDVPVPDLAGTQKYAASGPALFLCSGFTVTTPFSSRNFHKVPYLLYEYEENQGVLLQQFGEILRAKMNNGGDLGGSDNSNALHTQGKLTRQGTQSLTAMYRQGSESTWTYSRYWLSTAMYEFVQEDHLRQILYQKFPDGLKVSRVEGTVVKLENEALSDVWTAIMPEPGQTIYQDPICYGILGNQDIINDLYNIKVAKEERGLPSAIADAELIDADALSAKPYLPKEVISAKPSFGGSLREAIVPLPTPNADDGSASELIDRVKGNAQDELGLNAAVLGEMSSPTAEGQKLELSQGLMQLSVPGEMVTQGYVEIYSKACKLIAKYAPASFVVPVPDDKSGMTSEMIDLDALRAGKYHFEADPGMPMSYAEKQMNLNGIIQENPELANAMGFNSPLSAAAIRDFLLPGMPEIRSPLEDVRDKVIERIQELLKGQPIPGTPDPMTGQPGPMQPSIQPEPFVDQPDQHAELVREWMNSPPGRKAGQDPARAAGYQNVLAYGMLCVQMATPPPMPPPPPPPPKVSVSLKGTDPIGVQIAESAAGISGMNVPGQGGLPTPPPPGKQEPGPQGPPPGPPHGAPAGPPPAPAGPMPPQTPMPPPGGPMSAGPVPPLQ